MGSPSLRDRAASPERTATSERVIDVHCASPALLRSGSSLGIAADDENAADRVDDNDDSDAIYDIDDADTDNELTELELTEHEYRRGLHAVPMQSPGDEMEVDMDADGNSIGRHGRRRGRLPALRKRHFFESDDLGPSEFGRASSRGRILERITFRRRKQGEDGSFWMWILISNILSLVAMCMLMFYLMQTDFFESHQSDLFGTTVDNRFTVVSPESADAKIYMKSGYSTSRYSEAMIAFGNGELKIGRRALGPTDSQAFYGLSLENNGTATFTNKVSAPLVKTDYLHATRALVFKDGTVMTTAANLSGGINEVGDLNLVSQTGSITLSSGGKPILKVDPDSTVNVLNTGNDRHETMGITFDGVNGDIIIANDFQLHHDGNSTVVSTSNAVEINATRLLLGTVNATKAVLTCPPPTAGAGAKHVWAYKQMTLAIVGQSSANQSHGGDVTVSGGDGSVSGGSVTISGGESAEDDDGDVSHGSVMINAKLDRTSKSVTEIGSHGSAHRVSLHGAVSINNASESGHRTSLFVAGGTLVVKAKNVTLNNAATNGSSLQMASKRISLVTSSGPSLVLGANASELSGAQSILFTVPRNAYVSGSTGMLMDHSGLIQFSAAKHLMFEAVAPNSSTSFVGTVRFSTDTSDGNTTASVPDMVIDDGAIAIDAETLTIGAAGSTEKITLEAGNVKVGSTRLESNVTVAGETMRVSSKRIQMGSSGATLQLNTTTLSIHGETVTVTGTTLSIGDKSTQSIALGDPSAKSFSLASSAITIGTSAKSVSIGEKAAAITIGSSSSTVELSGKITVNGKALDAERRLEGTSDTFFGTGEANAVAVDVTNAGDALHLPLELGSTSTEGVASIADGDLWLGTATTAVTHVRMGLSVDGTRLRVTSTDEAASNRLQKLRCQVIKLGDVSVGVLTVATILETCGSAEECSADVFLGASSQRIVPATSGDRFTVRCVASRSGAALKGSATLLIDRVQLDVSSVV